MELLEIDMVRLLTGPLIWGILFLAIVAITAIKAVIDFIREYHEEEAHAGAATGKFPNFDKRKHIHHRV